jgi:hypothetical protein
MAEALQKKNEIETIIERFSRQITLTLLLKTFLEYLGYWGFVWGITVLIFRAGLQMPAFPAVWGLWGILPCLGLALISARQRTPTRGELRNFLDYWAGCGGILAVSGETNIQAWWQMLPTIPVPVIRWKKRRTTVFFLAAAGFALAAALVPIQIRQGFAAPLLNITQETKDLAEELKILAQEEALTEEATENLLKEMELLKENARGDDPAKTLESLDHLEQIAQKAAAEAAEKNRALAETLGKAQKLANDLADDKARRAQLPQPNEREMKTTTSSPTAPLATQSSELTPEQRARAEMMSALNEMMKDMMQDSGLTPEDLGMNASGTQSQSEMSTEDLKRMAEKMGGMRQMKLKKVAILKKGKKGQKGETGQKGEKGSQKGEEAYCESEDGENGENGAGKDGKEPDAYMLGDGKNPGKDGKSLLMFMNGNQPGDGGINRGRGDAPLNYSGQTDEQGFSLKDQVLPPSNPFSPENAQTIGIGISAPEMTPGSDPGAGGRLRPGETTGGTAFRRPILPKYRSTVKRYFQRK